MKKIISVWAFLVLNISLNAQPFLGGEITWSCNGNGNFVFDMVLYAPCDTLPSIPTQQMLNVSNGQTFACVLVDSANINPSCNNASSSISCSNPAGYQPIKRYTYRSAPVAIGTIPVGGLHVYSGFTYRPENDNLPTDTAQGFTLRAIMYPYQQSVGTLSAYPCYDSSPLFAEVPRFAFSTNQNAFFLDGTDPDLQDSTFFGWAHPLAYDTVYPPAPILFDTAYGYTSPLPGVLQSASNQPALLQGDGLLTFKSVNTGSYTYCYKVESWRDGQLISEVFRDFAIQIGSGSSVPGPCATGVNNPPTLAIQYYPNTDTLNPIVVNNQVVGYEGAVLAGDTVRFKLFGQDVELLSNCVPQSITLTASGRAMSSTLTPASGTCANQPCAYFASLNSNGSFTNTVTNLVDFTWPTAAAHVPIGQSEQNYIFDIAMADNNCPLPEARTIQLKIKVLRPLAIAQEVYRICQGDSAAIQFFGDTANLSWSTTNGISCTNCAQFYAAPQTSTAYEVTDLNTGYVISFTVLVDPQLPAPQLNVVGSGLHLANATAYDSVFWKRNYAPFFPQPIDNYTPWLSGGYWVGAESGACQNYSAHQYFWFTDNLSANTDSLGQWFDNRRANLTHGFSFSLENEPNYLLNAIYLHAFSNNTQGNLATAIAKIWDQQLALVFQTDSVVRLSDDIIAFYGDANLQGGADYLMGIYTDTSLTVPTFKPDKWPVVANQGRVLVYNASNAVGYTLPSNNAPDYPFVHFGLASHIGLGEERPKGLRIYPNPTQRWLYIDVEDVVIVQLFDLQGKMLVQAEVRSHAKLNLENFSNGIYLLKITITNGVQSTHRVVKVN